MNNLTADFGACRAGKEQQLKSIVETNQHQTENITKLFEISNKNNNLLHSLPAKIIGATAGIFVVLEIVNRVLERMGF